MNKENQNIEVALAGQSLSVWVPVGFWRRVIFCLLIFFGVIGVITSSEWYYWAMLLFASAMSPRVIGELAFALGRVVSLSSKQKK